MMGSAGFVARLQLRRRWRSVVLLTVLLGVLGGASISLIAGARRSASVVDRYFAASRPYDLVLFAPSLSADAVRSIPGVERADLSAYVAGVHRAPDGTPAGVDALALDPSSFDRTFQVLEGALPDEEETTAVVVNRAFTDQFALGVGDPVDLRMFGPDQYDAVNDGKYDPTGPAYTFSIAAIVRVPPDIVIDEVRAPGASADGGRGQIIMSARFYEQHRADFLDFGGAYDVQLAKPAMKADFEAAVAALTSDAEDPPLFGPARFSERHDTLRTPVGIESVALLGLGLALSIAGLVAVGLLLRAEQRTHDGEGVTMRALGFTRSQVGLTSVLRSLPLALGGALLAVGLAIALSGRYPVGIGRQIELDRGVRVDAAALLLGAIVILVSTLGIAYLLGRLNHSRPDVRRRRAVLARWCAQVGAPVDVTVGANLAFEHGRGARSAPSRAAIAGGAAALAVVAALVFLVGGIDHLYGDRPAHGWPWDVAIGNTNFTLSDQTVAALTHDPRVRTSTVARYGQATVDDVQTELLAVDVEGTAQPEVVSGRLPASDSEIALGARLLRRIGASVGDSVSLSIAGGDYDAGAPASDRDLTVVGVALAPMLGERDIGEAGVVTFDAIAASGGDTTPQLVLAQLRGDPAVVLPQIDRDVTQELMTDLIPARIVSLHRVRALPILGMLFAGGLGSIVLAYVLAIGVRTRMRDLAVLRALGMPVRRLTSVLTWQALMLATAMLVIGLPIGVLLGSVVWRSLARDFGVATEPVATPLLAILLPAVLLVAIVATLAPARRARRQQVAALLRVE